MSVPVTQRGQQILALGTGNKNKSPPPIGGLITKIPKLVMTRGSGIMKGSAKIEGDSYLIETPNKDHY